MEAFSKPHLYVNSTCLEICCFKVYELWPLFEVNSVQYVSLLQYPPCYLSHSQTYSKTFSLYSLASNMEIKGFKEPNQLESKLEFIGDVD